VKILVTGASGFVGRNLVAQYAERYHVATPCRRELDLLDAAEVRAYLERHRFDIVIHAATDRSNRKLGSGPELLNRNCRMFFNLTRNSHAFGRMFFLSSGAVYDRAHWHPQMSEDDFDKVRWAASLLFLASWSCNEYFPRFAGEYVNSSQFRVVGQRYQGNMPDFVAFVRKMSPKLGASTIR